ncbi:bone morphogenetic protein 2-like [Engraulis encrasicolus]|uniref:bone morphogenetic protein 2-like n=1 Tax=Engraulis encrasicolus TaxID=184585 RepID=UPI002FCF5BCB
MEYCCPLVAVCNYHFSNQRVVVEDRPAQALKEPSCQFQRSSPYADLLEGTVVRSFQDKGTAGGANGAFHFFSVTSLGRDERVLRAELRWYRRRQPHTHHFYKVDLYEVLNSGVQPWRGNLISSRLLPTHTQGWEIFNITHTVSRWVSDSSSNNGLLLVSSLSPWRWMEATPPNTDGPAPYLVVFSADEDSTAPSAPPPPGMMTSPGDKKRERRSASARRQQEGAGPAEPCHRKSLYVDFRLIGWSSWIIAPPGYEAFQCSGTCVFPLGEGTRASNHATVQALTHTLSPGRTHTRTHTPCCVPDALAPVSLLYFDEHDTVVLRQYRDMVAESCGCH